MKANNIVHLNRDRGYRFRDRDPVLEEITRIVTESGKSAQEISDMTAKASGGAHRVSPTTIHSWQSGKVKKPQNFTVSWVGYVLGYSRRWVKHG